MMNSDICKNLKAMLDDKLCYGEMTGRQVDAVNEAISALQAQSCSEKPNNWISVEDKLPERDSEAWYNIVLTHKHRGNMIVRNGYYDGYHKLFSGFETSQNYVVTHWMPLQQPPASPQSDIAK